MRRSFNSADFLHAGEQYTLGLPVALRGGNAVEQIGQVEVAFLTAWCLLRKKIPAGGRVRVPYLGPLEIGWPPPRRSFVIGLTSWHWIGRQLVHHGNAGLRVTQQPARPRGQQRRYQQ
jgi:hypothetical protein